MWVDRESQNILNKLFRILQSEVGHITYFRRFKNESSCLKNLLLQRFNSDFKKNKDLEVSIEEKIKYLEQYNYRSPKSMYGKYKTIKDKYEDITFERVKELILSLRERRIKVLKALLDDFKQDKKKYLDFMKENIN